MQQIMLPYLMDLSQELEQLGTLPDVETERGDIFMTLITCQYAIQTLIRSSVYAPYLRSSFQLGNELHNLLEAEAKTDLGTHPKIGQFQL